jgi:type III pantothenate kinase
MLLAIDIGNTNIKLGIYQDETLVHHWRVVTERCKLANEYIVLVHNLFAMANLDRSDVKGCVISSVVPPLNSEFTQLSHEYLHVKPIFVNSDVTTGMCYCIDNPYELGADRIANSLAAYRKYGGPVIAVAFGTATAFDVIAADGTYQGGAIAPGIGISAEALYRSAARLYQVEMIRPPHVIAKNTIHHIQAGVLLGYTGLVEGLVHRMQQELGNVCAVIATGGQAEIIAQETSVITAVEPYLTLEGLRFIYAMNRT